MYNMSDRKELINLTDHHIHLMLQVPKRIWLGKTLWLFQSWTWPHPVTNWLKWPQKPILRKRTKVLWSLQRIWKFDKNPTRWHPRSFSRSLNREKDCSLFATNMVIIQLNVMNIIMPLLTLQKIYILLLYKMNNYLILLLTSGQAH